MFTHGLQNRSCACDVMHPLIVQIGIVVAIGVTRVFSFRFAYCLSPRFFLSFIFKLPFMTIPLLPIHSSPSVFPIQLQIQIQIQQKNQN